MFTDPVYLIVSHQKENDMKRIFLLSVVALLSANAVLANDINQFIGDWSVNVDRTSEETKTSPKYNPESAKKDKQMLSRLAGAMQLQLTESSMSLVMGKRVEKIPYTIKSVSPSLFVAETNIQGKAVYINYSLREGKYLNMRITGSDNMKYYIWEKSVGGKDVESETKVITDILTDQMKK